MKHDVFISHASEDKEEVATPLASILQESHISVWLDANMLSLGDSLRRKIDDGLLKSRFGIVILSKHFFAKDWPQNELNALASREGEAGKVILPIRHKITHEEVKKFSPLLADKINVSTEKGLNFVAQEIAKVIRDKKLSGHFQEDHPVVVGISGASCSGKTWLARKFKQLSPESVCLFDLDGYYKDSHYVMTLEHKFDNPLAIDFDYALMSLSRLMSGHEIQVPIYNFETSKREGVRVCEPAPIILIEGVFAFANETLRKEIDIKVWIDAADDRRFERRLTRDTQERGRDLQKILDRYAEDVTPGYQKFVHPLREYADIIIQNNGRNSEFEPILLNMLLAYVERINHNSSHASVS